MLLWTLQRLAELSVDTKSSEISHLPSSLNCSVDNNPSGGSCSISVTAADIKHAQDANAYRRPSWIQPPVAEGITFEICGSELITSESNLSSVRLLLSQLCFGNKINEEVVFRVLPESFSSFLSLHPSHDTTITEDDNPAVPSTSSSSSSSSSGVKTSTTTPKFFETMKVNPRLKNMFRQYSSTSIGAQSADSSTLQSSMISNGTLEELGPLHPVAYRASILNNGGSEVRVSFAAKMGVRDKGMSEEECIFRIGYYYEIIADVRSVWIFHLSFLCVDLTRTHIYCSFHYFW